MGGSVRDLLLHKAPKDFDIATNATPQEIKRLFRNGRVIGRRFKLVHILFHREIIEVATFRGSEIQTEFHERNDKGMLVRDNVYGTIDEDAFRRDFTINSLYYNITDSSIIDFTGGVQDIHSKTLRIIGDPEERYKEDPVRMLRAIRFSAKLHFDLSPETQAPLKKSGLLITHVSSSRLFDEMSKLYQCGNALSVHNLMTEYGIFAHLFPQTHALIGSEYPLNAFLGTALENTDKRILENKPVTPAFLFAVLLWFPMINRAKTLQAEGLDPLPSIDKAMSLVIAEQNKRVCIPKRYSQVMREIWLLQYRFSKRLGKRAFNLLQHPRFRAAYDFLALRALAGDEEIELADWWTIFQDLDENAQNQMVAKLAKNSSKPRKRRRPQTKNNE